MSELDTLRDWYDFNAYARQRYLELFAKLSPQELSRDRGASYPTLLGILLHSIDAYLFWLGRASPSEASSCPNEPGPDLTLDKLCRFEHEVRTRMDRFVGGLTERDLARTFRMPKGGAITRDHELTIRDMLWHLVEEELQHRGELNALLWQADLDPPLFDWIDWVELPERRQTRGGLSSWHR